MKIYIITEVLKEEETVKVFIIKRNAEKFIEDNEEIVTYQNVGRELFLYEEEIEDFQQWVDENKRDIGFCPRCNLAVKWKVPT